MKRLATILMLVAIVLLGGMSVEAKTTKKKAKAKTSQTSGTSNIEKNLDLYEETVSMLSQWYDESCKCFDGAWGSSFINYAGNEEKYYKKLKKLENKMTSEQKSKFKKLAHSLNIR